MEAAMTEKEGCRYIFSFTAYGGQEVDGWEDGCR